MMVVGIEGGKRRLQHVAVAAVARAMRHTCLPQPSYILEAFFDRRLIQS